MKLPRSRKGNLKGYVKATFKGCFKRSRDWFRCPICVQSVAVFSARFKVKYCGFDLNLAIPLV